MIKKWEEGFDVIYATRTERPGESIFKLASARMFYRLLNKLTSVPIPLDTGDFRLMSRPVVEVIRTLPECDRFLRGMVSWVGFKQIALPYKRSERFAGETKWSVVKLVFLAIDGIISFSNKPLEFILSLGGALTFFTSIGVISILVQKFIYGVWASNSIILLLGLGFFSGIQLLSLGIVGLYVGRIYNQIKNRPLYIVKEYQGFSTDSLGRSRSPVVIQK